MTLVADAQRERALARLRRHYQEDGLDADELDARADRALRAQTSGAAVGPRASCQVSAWRWSEASEPPALPYSSPGSLCSGAS